MKKEKGLSDSLFPFRDTQIAWRPSQEKFRRKSYQKNFVKAKVEKILSTEIVSLCLELNNF